MKRNLKDFTERLGYTFKQDALLVRALSHDSASSGGNDNEHLEFLGDRVLGLVIAHALTSQFPDESEGDLARRMASLVSRDTCAVVATQWQLDKVIITDRKVKVLPRNIMADGCEAILGAIYLDGGLPAVERVIHRHWQTLIAAQITPPQDSKTTLQEYAMKQKLDLPLYETIEKKGPDHAPHFVVSVQVAGEAAQGQGASVRVAQAEAASAWLSLFLPDRRDDNG